MNVMFEDVAVPQAGDTVLFDVSVENYDEIGIEVKNSGAKAFDACTILGKFHPSGDDITIASGAGDYTAPDGKFMLKASGNLTVLAGGAVGWALLDIRALHRLKLTVSCADAAGTTASVYGIAK